MLSMAKNGRNMVLNRSSITNIREFTILDRAQDGDPWRPVNERGQGHLLCNSTVLPNSTPLLEDF